MLRLRISIKPRNRRCAIVEDIYKLLTLEQQALKKEVQYMMKHTLPWIRVRRNVGVTVELLHFLRNYNDRISWWVILYLGRELTTNQICGISLNFHHALTR